MDIPNTEYSKVIAARHICEEASKVLSTLRTGPPAISHGSLVHNLRELRRQVKSRFLDPQPPKQVEYCVDNDNNDNDNDNDNDVQQPVSADPVDIVQPNDNDNPTEEGNLNNDMYHHDTTTSGGSVSTSTSAADSSGVVIVGNIKTDHMQMQMQDSVLTDKETITVTNSDIGTAPQQQNQHIQQHPHLESVIVGVFAQPFLDIILDPRAAGPHTLIALRSLHRLVSRHTLTLTSKPSSYTTTNDNNGGNVPSSPPSSPSPSSFSNDFRFEAEMEPLMRGILDCRFEQTDVGADEAVEMAIADLLSLIVSLDIHRVMNADVIMEAFNTVFVTRNTFVHSPALCYHFEQVLDIMIRYIFANLHIISSLDGEKQCATAAKLIVEFLSSQLLHTPMTTMEGDGGGSGNGGGSSMLNNDNMEAFAMHNDTRILCFTLIQTCLKIGWGSGGQQHHHPQQHQHGHGHGHGHGNDETKKTDNTTKTETTKKIKDSSSNHITEDDILEVIKVDLCLSLLLIGQGIWAYQDPSSGSLPGVISMNVLSEVCSTISTLWSIPTLRNVLTTQFENIFTGFYQRALSLLRRLPVPQDSSTFHANQIFDAEVEIILESLVDILTLHSDDDDDDDDNNNDTDNNISTKKSALEALFITYDCNMNRPDVAAGLLEELSRCCSGNNIHELSESDKTDNDSSGDSAGGSRMPNSTAPAPVRQSSSSLTLDPDDIPQIRIVPAHLKELCAEALMGVMRTLFRGSTKSQELSQSENELVDNSLHLIKEKKIIMRKAVELFNEKSTTGFKFLIANGFISEPVTPDAIASFLRNGIILGLDKRAVGEYLGTKGKSPVAGKSPPDWERDWFHKEVLLAYCSSFRFENQSLLDGLRMFLAAFRLPGEAQQIDRILQAFAESCGLQCEEAQIGDQCVFSTDPKKASDGAYLLSFSIIMLNTDLHNDNIRADRKMKVEDFVKNNSDYGRDIMDPDKKLPREYLEGIYANIKSEQIRTEGEGADGVMTFERWKDVMRNSGESSHDQSQSNDATDLVIKFVQGSILNAICGFWGVSSNGKSLVQDGSPQSGMLGVQGARFGMDLSLETMSGLKSFSQIKLFQDFFVRICHLTGLLGEYETDGVERTSSFVESLEKQSAVVVVMRVASEYGDSIGSEGWSCIVGILFELRDLKLLGGGTQIKHRSLIIESDPDLLRSDTRRDWEMSLVKQCYEATGGEGTLNRISNQKKGLFGAMGRAIFGSGAVERPQRTENAGNTEMAKGTNEQLRPSEHGKEEQVLWDDLAPSDEEDGFDPEEDDEEFGAMNGFSLADEFENQLIKEDQNASQPGPITGLETYEDTRIYQLSPRARVRKRLSKLCDFSVILSETRFLDLEGVKALLNALTQIFDAKTTEDSSNCKTLRAVSPGSEAFAEVMIIEIALKNRDRIAALWYSCLKPHYERRLTVIDQKPLSQAVLPLKVIPGIEKCLTGLLRICYHTVHREGVNNEVLQTLKLLCPYSTTFASPLPLFNFNKHIAEGLWRICRDVDGLLLVGFEGWEGILDLISHCARGGETLVTQYGAKTNNLSDDDPALQAFRCMHLILHSVQLRNVIPFHIVYCVRALINGGEKQNCPKLSLAGLDLLLVLLTRLHLMADTNESVETEGNKWSTCWIPIVEGIAEASDSKFPSTRQHSMTMLRDALIDKYSDDAPVKELCRVLNGVCMPIVSQRISELIEHQDMLKFDREEILIELELCISVIFKPFLHHLEKLASEKEELTAVWMSMISVISHLLGEESTQENGRRLNNSRLVRTTKDLATERFRDSVMVLMSKNILKCDDDITSTGGKDISSMTWNAISNIAYCQHLIPEWKENGKKQET